MAAVCIDSTGNFCELSYTELTNLQEFARSVSVVIVMDIRYTQEEALATYEKLLPHKDRVPKKFLTFIQKSNGFIIY